MLTIKRGHEPLVKSGADPRRLPAIQDGARLRLSVSIEALRVQRLLVPLFAGGVTVTFQLDPLGGLSIDVLPLDLEKQSLVKALSTALGDEGQAIWSDFAKRRSVDQYIFGDLEEDPWIATVASLLPMRFASIDDSQELHWATALCERFSWIPDCHVLLARTRLLKAGDLERDRVVAADEALAGLCTARRLGAPFFCSSNSMLAESLTGLSDGAPLERQRNLAAEEIVRWRRNLPHQRKAGASFSWVMTNGARSRGGLDERYSRVLAQGQISHDLLELHEVVPSL
jgi:hypothetical protein